MVIHHLSKEFRLVIDHRVLPYGNVNEVEYKTVHQEVKMVAVPYDRRLLKLKKFQSSQNVL